MGFRSGATGSRGRALQSSDSENAYCHPGRRAGSWIPTLCLPAGIGVESPGYVLNSPHGVFVEIEGEKPALENFLFRLQQEKPAPSFIQSLEASYLDPVHFNGFEIRGSASSGMKSALILPDIATCPDCLSEILDPGNRRYRYPFTNCTHCGPRFTIIESSPTIARTRR